MVATLVDDVGVVSLLEHPTRATTPQAIAHQHGVARRGATGRVYENTEERAGVDRVGRVRIGSGV